MYTKMKCKILIPFYTNELSDNEKLAFKNILKYYDASMICLFLPENLEVKEEYADFEKQGFDPLFFENVMTYNNLMLSKDFYERFSECDYILLHQLDAFMFKDELDHWCHKNYDYIGAPWLKSNNPFSQIFKSKKLKNRAPIFNKVGNGGFSLRKVKTFLKFFEKHQPVINEHKSHPLYSIEDVFWSLIAPQYVDFKIPEMKEAAKFCLDRKPEIGLKLNNGQLPFGCHGFEKSKTKSFWQKYIEGLQ